MLRAMCVPCNAATLCVYLAGASVLAGAARAPPDGEGVCHHGGPVGGDLPWSDSHSDAGQTPAECMLQEAATMRRHVGAPPLAQTQGTKASAADVRDQAKEVALTISSSYFKEAARTRLMRAMSIAKSASTALRARVAESASLFGILASVLLILGILSAVLTLLSPGLEDLRSSSPSREGSPGRLQCRPGVSQQHLTYRADPPVVPSLSGYDRSRSGSTSHNLTPLAPVVPGTWRQSFIPDTVPALHPPSSGRGSNPPMSAPGFGRPPTSMLSLPPVSARGGDPHEYYMCLELVVPEARECTLLMPRPWIGKYTNLSVADARGVAVFHVSFVNGKGRYPHDYVRILASADDGAQFGVLGEVTQAPTLGPCVTLYNSSGGIFGILKVATHAPRLYVLDIRGRDCVFVSGDIAAGAKSVKDEEGRLLAIAEPRGDDTRAITVGPLVDAGLMLLCFMGVDMLEHAKYTK